MTDQKNKYIKIFVICFQITIPKTNMEKIFLEVIKSSKHSGPVRKTYL